MSRLKQLVVEMHRRSIWQVLGIYLVGSWVAYQVTLGIVDGLGLPDWVPPFAIILFIIGLPIVLATAFIQEGLPGTSAAAREAAPPELQPVPERRTEPAVAPQLRRHFTWHRAITGGVLAFATLGLGVSGFMGMRALGVGPFGSLAARGELGDNGVLVAEFEPLTGDSLIARVVGEAFRVDISQSSLLHGVDRQRTRYALERMGKPADTRVAGDVAREIAVRLGIAVVLEGEVGQAGGGYLLTARLVTPDSGRVLFTGRETARDSTELLPAVDRLSRLLRERAGESLKTIRATPPLAQVTTSSLPALRLYMEGRQAIYTGDGARALSSYQQALQLDPDFASAHNAVAVTYYNWGWRGDTMLHHFRRALEQSERLTERERHHTRGMYAIATGRLQDARAEFEAIVARDSTDVVGLINLGVVYSQLGENARAEEMAHRAEQAGYGALNTTFWNQLMAQLDQRAFDRARQTIARTAQEHPTARERTQVMQVLVQLAETDYDAAEATLDSMSSDRAAWQRQLYQVMRGRRQSLARERSDHPMERAWDALLESYRLLWVQAQPETAARRLSAAVRDPVLDTIPVGDRPDSYAALVLAAAGDVRGARELIARVESGIAAELRTHHDTPLLAARGFIRAHEGQRDSAIIALRNAQRSARCRACLESLRGQVFELVGMPDSAAASYSRYIETGWQDRHLLSTNVLPNDIVLLALSHERAGILYDQLGQPEKARSHYASFVTLWENAVPELQPRVQAARQRLAALSGERAR